MRFVTVKIKGTAPYSQSYMHETPMLDKETKDAHDLRTWRNKCTTDEDGFIVIPAMGLKMALDSAAKKLGDQIPGKGKSTYTKFFVADVICNANAPIYAPHRVHKDDVEVIAIQVTSDGVRGSGKRVKRHFPIIPPGWEATAEFTIMDDTVTREVFERTLRAAGASIGIGRFRPEKGGLNGRFVPVEFAWQ